MSFRGSTSYILSRKLKEVKSLLKAWNRDCFGRLDVNKKLALSHVEDWDRVEEVRELTLEEIEAKKEAKDSFKKWVTLKEIYWRQKSRETWLKAGDRNTGFFHRMTNSHFRRNTIARIKINGVWIFYELELREGISSAIQSWLFDDKAGKAEIDGLPFSTLSPKEASSLELPFREEEVFTALNERDGDKASSSDGFSLAFWQDSWHFVKDEIMEMFREFHANETFIKSLNVTFLVLIPKKGDAEDLKDFRPISLLGSLYKILTKVLVNRLKKVVGKVVSEAQNAFVEAREITNVSLIANELIDHWQKQREKGVICKLDIEKAFDNINWQFLMKVMRCMGFVSKWMRWIWQCISTERFSVLVNRVPAGFFPSSRRLRQGDSLTPYLFILGMEVLSILLRRAMTSGFISGCTLRGREGADFNISHLLYVDDTIIFCKAKEDKLLYLSWVVLWFETSLGLKINLDKSELIPIGVVDNLDALVV